jgi:O-antigen/teichoic acid export membrane protein
MPGAIERGRSERRVAERDLIDAPGAGPAAMRGSLLRVAGYVAGLGLALIAAPLIVRYLGDAEFGRYSAVLATIVIVGGLTEGGVNTVALRELSAATDRDERRRLMSDLLGLRLAASVGGVAIAVGFTAAAGYGPALVLGTLLAGAGMLLAVTQTLLATALQSRLRFGWAAAIEVVRQAVSTLLIVVLVVADAGVVAFLAVGIPAGLAALALTVPKVRGMVSLRPAFHPRRWGALVRDTAVFAIAIAVNTLYFRVALLVMAVVATAIETGYFAISYRVMEVLVGVPALLVGAAFPIVSRTARSDRVRFQYAASRLFELGVLAGTLAALALFVCAPFAIEILTGHADHPSTVVLQIQSAALIASFVAAATGFPLLSMKRNVETLIANCTSLVVALALAFALAPDFGARGAAIAAVTADFALAAVNTAALVRRGGPQLPLSVVPVAVVAGAPALVAALLLDVHPLIEGAVATLVYLAVLAAVHRFPPEVRELLRGTAPAEGR